MCDCGRRTGKFGSNYLPDRRSHTKKRLLCHCRTSAGALNACYQLRLKLVCSENSKFVQLLRLYTTRCSKPSQRPSKPPQIFCGHRMQLPSSRHDNDGFIDQQTNSGTDAAMMTEHHVQFSPEFEYDVLRVLNHNFTKRRVRIQVHIVNVSIHTRNPNYFLVRMPEFLVIRIGCCHKNRYAARCDLSEQAMQLNPFGIVIVE